MTSASGIVDPRAGVLRSQYEEVFRADQFSYGVVACREKRTAELLLGVGEDSAFRETGATEAVNVALSLVRHNLFANPNPSVETGPTATVPPVYPYFLSLLLRLTGDGVGFVLGRVCKVYRTLTHKMVAAISHMAW
jgi:hypothetical protein